jgi:hypothetical protein
MRTRNRIGAATLAGLVISSTLVSATAAGPAATKQRVAVEIRFSTTSNRGTFKLIPLSPGSLKKDSGTFRGVGELKPKAVNKLGQTFTRIDGEDRYAGQRGTFVFRQVIESISAGFGRSCDVGTFRLVSGTGAYAGLVWSGGFSAASTGDSPFVLGVQEGYVTTS